MSNPEYRFFITRSCSYSLQADVIFVGQFGTRLEVTVADATPFAVGGGQLVAYEEVIDGENIIMYATTLSAEHGLNSIQLQVSYDEDPIKVINWIAILDRTQVYVNDFFSGKYVWERNELQYMRKTFAGKLMLKNDASQNRFDYDLIVDSLGVDCCCTFILAIAVQCGRVWALDFRRVFNAPDCVVNAERCTVTFEVQPYDTYRCILENGEPEVNVLDIADTESVDIDYTNNFEFVDCADTDPSGVILPWTAGFPNYGGCQAPDVDAVAALGGSFIQTGCIIFGEGWIPYETTVYAVDIGGNLVQVTQKYFREFKLTLDVGGVPNAPDGTGWIDVGPVSPTIDGTRTKWVRRPFDGYYDTYDYTLVIPCTNTVVAKIIIPGTTITYDRCRSFADVLDYVAKETCGQVVGIRSDFFNINPVGDSPDYVAGENYVTEAANQLNDLLVLQKSDFLTPDSSNAATKGLITFKNLIADVCTLFNMGWYIDADGYLRIEHRKYFEAYQLQNSIDLTGERANNGQRLYEYDKTNLPQKETWAWMDEVSDDFNGYPITYDPNCTDETQADKSYRIENFTTDVDYMQAGPSEISSEGFVLIARSGTDAIQATSPVSGLVINNGPLAQVTLQPAYYKWGRVLIDGVMNGDATAFDSALHLRKTKNLILKGCCQDFTFENSYAITPSGNCLIERVEQDPLKNIYTFNLKTDGNC